MSKIDKPLVWLHGHVKTPPFSAAARVEAGTLPRRLQTGERLALPYSRPMPGIDAACHELRVVDRDVTWRVIYCLDPEAVVILDVFAKKTGTTPKSTMATCQQRLAMYRRIVTGRAR